MNPAQAQTILDQLKQYIAAHAPLEEAPLLQKLVDFYYIAVSRQELLDLEIPRVYERLYSHFNFMRTRQVGQIKLSVFNPHLEKDGFTSNRSVIELTQDDMPFLIDSLLNNYCKL